MTGSSLPSDTPSGDSPRMTGPAGGQFEVSVGVHYALAVLAVTEAFGLPGAIAAKIAFQRRDQGHPLDDIILTGVGSDGAACTLEIQAKRSLSFTRSNAKFCGIVADMVAACDYSIPAALPSQPTDLIRQRPRSDRKSELILSNLGYQDHPADPSALAADTDRAAGRFWVLPERSDGLV